MYQKEIRNLDRVGSENRNAKMSNPNYAEFIELIHKHDYSYMMSDDDRVWQKGSAEVKRIQSLIGTLIEGGENVLSLKLVALDEVPQKFNDVDSNGNDLTHRVIRSWFTKFENN